MQSSNYILKNINNKKNRKKLRDKSKLRYSITKIKTFS
jgi:hypothetical protein